MEPGFRLGPRQHTSGTRAPGMIVGNPAPAGRINYRRATPDDPATLAPRSTPMQNRQDPTPQPGPSGPPHRRVLITAGPTHEPIDGVRYIANRSSGRVGIAIAEAAARLGCDVTLLLGPTPRSPQHTRIRAVRFQSTADLERLLAEHFPTCDLLIMAAAVADYRPRNPSSGATKLRRTEQALTLELEPTPDLLAAVAKAKRPGQTVVGFALEPAERLMESARSKLARKNLDFIVANPLETMDAPTIAATVIGHDGSTRQTPGAMEKEQFGEWLVDLLANQPPKANG